MAALFPGTQCVLGHLNWAGLRAASIVGQMFNEMFGAHRSQLSGASGSSRG